MCILNRPHHVLQAQTPMVGRDVLLSKGRTFIRIECTHSVMKQSYRQDEDRCQCVSGLANGCTMGLLPPSVQPQLLQ